MLLSPPVASDRRQTTVYGSSMNAHCGYWSMRLSRHVWTIATDCLPSTAWPFVNGCSKFRTALLVWYIQNLLLATLHHCCAGYTGYTSYKAYNVQVMRPDVKGLPRHGLRISNRLCSRCSDQRLRSSTRGNFVVRQTRTRFADSSFTVAGPAA